MMEYRNRLIVHGLMKINGKYLVIKRSIIKRGKPNVYPEYWDIPGGSVEDYETPTEALVREAMEEVGLNVKVQQIIHEDSQYDEGKNTMFTRLIYECDILDQDINITLDPQEHSQYRFIADLHDLQDEKVIPYLTTLIHDR